MNETKICKHCHYKIPKKATVCPYCRKSQTNWKRIITTVISLYIIVGTLALFIGDDENISENETIQAIENDIPKEETVKNEEVSEKHEVEVVPQETEEEYKTSCEEYKYKDVLRNPENYVGKRVKVTVRLFSVHEASLLNDTKYYFAYSESDYGWHGNEYGVFDKREEQDLKLLEDDIITVYGEISDPKYTKSLILSSSELFCIDMKYIDFISE